MDFGVIPVHQDAVCKLCMGPGALGHARLDISSVDQPSEAALDRRAAASKLFGDLTLSIEIPAELVGPCPDKAQHLEVATLQSRIADRAGRND